MQSWVINQLIHVILNMLPEDVLRKVLLGLCEDIKMETAKTSTPYDNELLDPLVDRLEAILQPDAPKS